MIDHRTILAARNNADWYSMMFDVHGLKYARSKIAFIAADTPPRFHSRMVSLDPEAREPLRQIIDENLHHADFEFKDSFDCLVSHDDNRLKELFSASWIHTDTVETANTKDWIKIASKADLSTWEHAWKDNNSIPTKKQFPNSILERQDVAIWGRRNSNSSDDPIRFDAGVIANTSSDCVGMSNLFGRNAYPAAATLCAGIAPSLPVVGHERGQDLVDALDTGFTVTGQLRVWANVA